MRMHALISTQKYTMGATDRAFSQFVPGVSQELFNESMSNFAQFIFIAEESASISWFEFLIVV